MAEITFFRLIYLSLSICNLRRAILSRSFSGSLPAVFDCSRMKFEAIIVTVYAKFVVDRFLQERSFDFTS